jgi:hypothetical protein
MFITTSRNLFQRKSANIRTRWYPMDGFRRGLILKGVLGTWPDSASHHSTTPSLRSPSSTKSASESRLNGVSPCRYKHRRTAPMLQAALRLWRNRENGGSGGARTRRESLIIKCLGGVPSQIASQKPVTLCHDLAQVVAAWDKLSAPLKAAIIAIANTATNKGGK